MKRLLFRLLFICIVLFACIAILSVLGPVGAERFQGAEGSGELTSDAVISSGPAFITSVLITTNGTNDATLIIYDNATEASGTIRWRQTVKGADNYGGKDWSFPKYFYYGMYADIEGTGARYIVEKLAK